MRKIARAGRRTSRSREKNGFGANIWIPALTIDGYVVGPREKFDFWKAVGPVTRAKGYRQGGAIINGRTEPQGALAGGICSCSTTLFNAALRAGFPMGARRNHYYYIDRYPLGLDATVFISASGCGRRRCPGPTTPTTRSSSAATRSVTAAAATSGSSCTASRTGGRSRIGTADRRNVRPASDCVQYTSSLAPGATQADRISRRRQAGLADGHASRDKNGNAPAPQDLLLELLAESPASSSSAGLPDQLTPLGALTSGRRLRRSGPRQTRWRGHRQRPETDPGRRRHGVGDGRRRAADRSLADPLARRTDRRPTGPRR